MQTRGLLFAVVLALLASGCAGVPHRIGLRTPPLDCAQKTSCDIPVNALTGDVPETVYARVNQTTTLQWQIPNASLWRFDTPGIVFGSDARTVMTCNPNPAGNERTVVCQNSGAPSANPDGYKYTVRLKMLGVPSSYDPFVLNR